MTTATLLDHLISHYSLKNDAGLVRRLGTSGPYLSKMRNNRQPFGPAFILRTHEEFDMPIKEIKAMLAEPEPEIKRALEQAPKLAEAA